jgi:hypothetical protein
MLQLLLMSVLNCVYDSVQQILRKNVEKRALLENLDVVLLALDEICDRGWVHANSSGSPSPKLLRNFHAFFLLCVQDSVGR